MLVAAVAAATMLMGMIAYTPTWAQEKKKDPKTVEKKTVSKSVIDDESGKKKIVTKNTTSVDVIRDTDIEDVRISVSVNDDNSEPSTKVVVVTGKTTDLLGYDSKNSTSKVVISKTIGGAEQLQKELDGIKEQLANVDWEGVKTEITTALASLDKELGIDVILKEVNTGIKIELNNSDGEPKEIQKETVKKRNIIKNDDAPHSDNRIEEMLNEMQSEGLLDRNKKYKVVKKDNDLYINGKKQSAVVYNKYNNYLMDETVEIKGSRSSLVIKKSNSRD